MLLIRITQQFRWDFETECLCGFDIDDQLELGRLIDRQVCRLLALENARSLDAGAAIAIREAISIAHEAACTGHLPIDVNGRNRMACRERRDLFAPARQEGITSDDQRPDVILNNAREGGVDVADAQSVQDYDLQPEGASRLLQFGGLARGFRIVGIEKERDCRNVGDQIMQQAKPLRTELGTEPAYPGDVAPRSIETCDQPVLPGVVIARENDRDRLVAAFAAIAGLLPPVATITETGR